MLNKFRNFFWHLPPDLRRSLAPSVMPKRYRSFQRRLQVDVQSSGSTLKPFLDHQCIFVHIPKAAGIAVTTSLFGGITGSHIKLVEYQTMLSKEQFEQFFKFTLVRSPWDRTVSAFHFLKRGGINKNDRVWAQQHLAPYDTFDEFAKRWLNRRNILLHSHFRPQYQFISLPREDEPSVDFIGRFESIEDDFKRISTRLGIQATLQGKNVGDGRIKDYKQYYTDETAAIVAQLYHKDIELFGYSFA